MSRLFYALAVAGSLLLGLASCGGRSDSTQAPDVEHIAISYTAYPFYRDFSQLDPKNMAAGLQNLKSKYPRFLDIYLDRICHFGFGGQYNDSNQMLYDFLTEKDHRQLLDTVNKAFPDTRRIDDRLRQTFRYIKYYDSSFTLPQDVYYFVSGLNGLTVALLSEKEMAVGLDMFLGRDFLPYAQLNKSSFETIRMTEENIPVWTGRALFEDKYPFIPEEKTLLELMVAKGKELYFLEKVTPYLKDEVRMGFTGEQMKWCRENEALIYNFFVSNKLLFERNLQKIMRYVIDGPSSSGMPAESPGNTGSFIGWRIVKQYAEKNNLSLHEVLETKDAQKILEGARYKP